MAENKVTPEEKLLKIIEGTSGGSRFKGKDSQEGHPKGADGGKSFLLKIFKIRTVNLVLGMICGVLLVFLIFDFMARANNYEVFISGFKPETNKIDSKVNKLAFVLDADQSVDYAKKRNIFSLIVPEEKKAGSSSAENAQVLNNLALVGIIWSETNPQAMIEDKNSSKTNLVSNGDTLGDFKVKKIQMDKVILNKQDQEYVLE